jgi:hypothetical protein
MGHGAKTKKPGVRIQNSGEKQSGLTLLSCRLLEPLNIEQGISNIEVITS